MRKHERVLINMDEARPRGEHTCRLTPAPQPAEGRAGVSAQSEQDRHAAQPSIHFSLLQRNQLEARSARVTPPLRARWDAIDTVTQNMIRFKGVQTRNSRRPSWQPLLSLSLTHTQGQSDKSHFRRRASGAIFKYTLFKSRDLRRIH